MPQEFTCHRNPLLLPASPTNPQKRGAPFILVINACLLISSAPWPEVTLEKATCPELRFGDFQASSLGSLMKLWKRKLWGMQGKSKSWTLDMSRGHDPLSSFSSLPERGFGLSPSEGACGAPGVFPMGVQEEPVHSQPLSCSCISYHRPR